MKAMTKEQVRQTRQRRQVLREASVHRSTTATPNSEPGSPCALFVARLYDTYHDIDRSIF